MKTLKSLRRCLDVSPEVAVVRDIKNKELRLYTDAGRCCRPLLIVEDKKILLKKSHIMKLQRKVCLYIRFHFFRCCNLLFIRTLHNLGGTIWLVADLSSILTAKKRKQ